jgi:hypothetical protein
MNRNGLIALQVVGGLSILPYPFVLLANIMSIAAPGHTPLTQLPFVLLSFYPLVWIALYVVAWRAMARGAVNLAFGLSSIPVFASLAVVGVLAFSWIGFGLGTMGIGPGGLHSTVYPDHNPLVDAITLAGQDVQILPAGEAVNRALREIDANPALINVSVPSHGTPLNVALRTLSISLDGTLTGDRQVQQDRIRLVRALVAHGAHLSANEATDLHETWLLRRALYDGPVNTRIENPLVWRIVTHDRGESMLFNPLTGQLPPRRDSPAPFLVKPGEIPLLNRPTRLHGTPLYAGLLDNANDVCSVIIKAGGRLSAEEQRDPAVTAALQSVFERDPNLRAAYKTAP